MLISTYITLCLIVSTLWTSLDTLPIQNALITFLILIACASSGNEIKLYNILKLPKSQTKTLLVLVTAFIGLWLFLGRLDNDFPFVGDHDHHTHAIFQSFSLFDRWYLGLVLYLIGFIAFSRSKLGKSYPRTTATVGVAVILLVGGLAGNPANNFFSRYPGGFYFLAYPLTKISTLIDGLVPYNALRITNMLSIPFWLLVLRPAFLGKAIDRLSVLILLIVFFQTQFVYYFSTTYLEPWSLVFVLLSLEALLEKPVKNYPLAMACLGIACIFKETSILCAPFFVLIRMFNKEWRLTKNELSWTFASVGIFLFYWFVRIDARVWRKFQLISSPEELFSQTRISELVFRLETSLGWNIFAILVVMSSVFLSALKISKGRERYSLLLFYSAAIFMGLFFYVDKVSIFWTGYPRFYMVSWIFTMVPALVILSREAANSIRVKALLAVLVGFILVPSIKTFGAWKSASEFNYFEHYDAPLYIGLNKIPPPNQTLHKLRILDPLGLSKDGYKLDSLQLYAPYLSRYSSITIQGFNEWTCDCPDPGERIILSRVLGNQLVPESSPSHSKSREFFDRCLSELKQNLCQLTPLTTNPQTWIWQAHKAPQD